MPVKLAVNVGNGWFTPVIAPLKIQEKQTMKAFHTHTAVAVMLMTMTVVYGDIPEQPRTEFIYANGQKIKLEDGADLSWKDLRNIEICYSCETLKNVKFDHSELSGADFQEVSLENCSFKNARIYYGNFSGVSHISPTCDFTDAVLNAISFQTVEKPEHVHYPGVFRDPHDLNMKMRVRNPSDAAREYKVYPEEYFRPGVRYIMLSKEQLVSTRSFKGKDLRGISFWGGNYSGTDFSRFDLRGTSLGGILHHCNFTDARIEHTEFGYGFTWEQLSQTKDYKEGRLRGLWLSLSWPDGLINLSGYDLSDTYFGHGETFDPTILERNSMLQYHDFASYFKQLPTLPPGTGLSDRCQLNLMDAVITNCNFSDFKGLSLENVKSTWNYKHGRMVGIALPEEIQKALDAEKEK